MKKWERKQLNSIFCTFWSSGLYTYDSLQLKESNQPENGVKKYVDSSY